MCPGDLHFNAWVPENGEGIAHVDATKYLVKCEMSSVPRLYGFCLFFEVMDKRYIPKQYDDQHA